ncbi:hypothetical protein F4814DRAFT_341958 [Daldinia grandis]|nr:hypothetical protein F4814DRAFT_341958 [Daldinia grandis]
MLAVDTDRRSTARDLLSVQNLLLLASQANRTTIISSAAPTPINWTQTVATAFFQGNLQPTQRNRSMQPSQPNPVAIPLPNVPPNRPAHPGAMRGRLLHYQFQIHSNSHLDFTGMDLSYRLHMQQIPRQLVGSLFKRT